MRTQLATGQVDTVSLQDEVERTDSQYRLLKQIFEMINGGHITPLPMKVFSFAEIVSAFRYMQSAKHIGKIVISDGLKINIEVPVSGEIVRVKHTGLIRVCRSAQLYKYWSFVTIYRT